MPSDKEHQEISVMGRLLSLEALLFLMGVASFLYGVCTGGLWNMLLGGGILAVAALVALNTRRGK